MRLSTYYVWQSKKQRQMNVLLRGGSNDIACILHG